MNPDFWEHLPKKFPIFDPDSIKNDEIDNLSNIPFSFKRSERKRRIYKF